METLLYFTMVMLWTGLSTLVIIGIIDSHKRGNLNPRTINAVGVILLTCITACPVTAIIIRDLLAGILGMIAVLVLSMCLSAIGNTIFKEE